MEKARILPEDRKSLELRLYRQYKETLKNQGYEPDQIYNMGQAYRDGFSECLLEICE